MAVPTIDPTRAAVAAVLGIEFEYQAIAVGASSWAARYTEDGADDDWHSGVPDGLSFRTTDGRISGKPTTIGQYVIELTPSNGDGAGEPYLLGLEVYTEDATPANMALRLNWDIDSGKVTCDGVDLSEWYDDEKVLEEEGYDGPRIFLGAPGTKRDVSLATTRGGSGQPVTVSNMKLVIADSPTDTAISVLDDAPVVDGSLTATRYRGEMDFSSAAVAALVSGIAADCVAQFIIESPNESESSAAAVDETKSITMGAANTLYPASFALPCTQAGTYLLRIQCLTSNYDQLDYMLAVRLENAGSGLTIASRTVAEVGDLTSPSESKFFDSDTDSGTTLTVTSNPLADTITWAAGVLTVSVQAIIATGGTPFNPSMKASLAAKSLTPTQNPAHSNIFPVRLVRALA